MKMNFRCFRSNSLGSGCFEIRITGSYIGEPQARHPRPQTLGPKIFTPFAPTPKFSMQQTPPVAGGGCVPTQARAGDGVWRPRGRELRVAGGVPRWAAASYRYVILVIIPITPESAVVIAIEITIMFVHPPVGLLLYICVRPRIRLELHLS